MLQQVLLKMLSVLRKKLRKRFVLIVKKKLTFERLRLTSSHAFVTQHDVKSVKKLSTSQKLKSISSHGEVPRL